MRIYEIIESVSIGSASRDLIDGMVTRFADMHSKIRNVLQSAANNAGGDISPRTIGMLAGGQKAKVKAEEYDRVLKPALYELYKTTKDADLKQFLSDAVNEQFKMGDIEVLLPSILINIAHRQKNTKLEAALNVWTKEIEKTDAFIDKLLSDSEPEPNDEPKEPKAPNPIAQQNAQADKIINDVLGRIDKKQAGEIRNSIAKSANKLAALQSELTRRGIKV